MPTTNTQYPIPNIEFGSFSPAGKSYTITTPNTPRHWYNYLWNEHYVSLVSQIGQGESFSQDGMGNRIPLVSARMLFVRDQRSGEFWAANGVAPGGLDYRCTHARGHSTIELTRNDIATSFRLFAPPAFLGEIWTLRITNTGTRRRQLQLFPFVDTLIDGPGKPQAYYMSVGRWDESAQAVTVTAECQFEDARRCTNFLTSSHAVAGYDSNERAFVGYGTWQRPDALLRGACGNSACEMEKPILALEHHLTLEPGEGAVLHWLVGTTINSQQSTINNQQSTESALRTTQHEPRNTQHATRLRERFFVGDGVDAAFRQVQDASEAELGQIVFSTPDSRLDQLATHWLPRQISLGAQWARVRHNGFRDQMQDIGAMAFFNPQRALQQFERVLAYQYSSGYAPRTWLHGRIQDRDFADNHVWIAFTAHNLVMESGDLSILHREVPFNDGSSATIYEHVRRAVAHLWGDRGRFGLCRIHGGDWNDGLDQVGVRGEGVSVWLSMAWYLANRQLAGLAQLLGDNEQVGRCQRRGEQMQQAVDAHAWDGEYYLRAYDDDGKPVGSHTNQEGTLFLNPQTWAVLSGIAVGDKGRRALAYAEAQLQSDLGIRCLQNPYTRFDPTLGLISRKTPGIQENGGVYLHASAFKLVADAMLGRRQTVPRGIADMLPFDRDAEPYVFSNCYFTIEECYRYGTTGQSWGTGAAGWFYVALLNHVFGLKPEMAGLRIDPCLPPSWETCAVTRPFREALYHIRYTQTGDGGRIAQIMVDGQPWREPVLPVQPGRTYQVSVTLS